MNPIEKLMNVDFADSVGTHCVALVDVASETDSEWALLTWPAGAMSTDEVRIKHMALNEIHAAIVFVANQWSPCALDIRLIGDDESHKTQIRPLVDAAVAELQAWNGGVTC
jgi:hypothetical protein